MSAPKYQLGSIDLNDKSHYWCDADGVDLGEMQTTWDEQVNLAGGANVQTNVQRGGLVACTFPMWVEGSSTPDLETYLALLWIEVDKATNTLVTDSYTYATGYSTRPASIIRDTGYVLNFRAEFVLVIMRQPGSS